MKRTRILLVGLSGLIGIWALAAGGMWFARSQKMTADKALDYLAAHPLKSQLPSDRQRIIDGMAKRVNGLPFEERQKFRFEKSVREMFEEMNDEEKARYLDLTLPSGMKQMIEAFNGMTPEKRKQIVSRAVNDLSRSQTDVNREELQKAFTDESMKKIIGQGLKAYMTEANAAAKIDAQPLIEQMQSIMQGVR